MTNRHRHFVAYAIGAFDGVMLALIAVLFEDRPFSFWWLIPGALVGLVITVAISPLPKRRDD